MITNDTTDFDLYKWAMESGAPYIRLKLDTDAPIEMGEFVGAFTSIAAQYDRYIRAEKPDADPEATLFIKEIRQGCIEADLVPWLKGAAYVVGGGITFAAAANTLGDFVDRYGKRLGFYKKDGAQDAKATMSEIAEIVDQVAPIASAPGAALEVAAIEVKNGKHEAKAVFKFNTSEARQIKKNAGDHLRIMQATANATHTRVTMIFVQSNSKASKSSAKRTGDRVIIDRIAPGRDVALSYASDLAEQAIKHQIREAEDNIYHKGFDVDVIAELRNGKPITYRVTHLHGVFDLPRDQDD